MLARKLLFPFSLLYGSVVYTRNMFYDHGVFESKKYELPIICVGNLNVGGTGKSPMVAYLLNLLKQDFYVASLSRGYKRSSKGFLLLNGDETALEVGDEPLQFKKSFPNVAVAVDEDRQHGIAKLLKIKKPNIIILDDALQHRKVSAGFNILLTAYNDLYTDDLLLPAGNLREPKTAAARADVIVVTKCPRVIDEAEIAKIEKKLKPMHYQTLFFTSVKYAEFLKNKERKVDFDFLKNKRFALVTGIAKPEPLVEYLKNQDLQFDHLDYPDHHHFSNKEIEKMKVYDHILTTEKDFMRLENRIDANKLFYLPIEVQFLRKEKEFQQRIFDFVKK